MTTPTESSDRVARNLRLMIPGTGKSFEVDLTTTARWEGEQMVEEWVFWDSALMAQQIGLA